jgi:hypothetical protein
MTNNKIKTGGILAGAGCLVPVALSLITLLAFGGDDGNPPDWVAPFWLAGAVVMIVGLVIAIVGATERKREGLTGSASTSADKSGSKTADVQRRANKSIKTGGILAGAGCLFGIAPLALALAAAAIGSDAANVLPWATYLTAPVGAVVVIVGLIIAIVGATKSTPEDLAKSVSTIADKSGSKTAAGPGTPSAPVALPPLSDSLARSVKIAYAFGFVVLLVSCAMRVTIFQPFSGILTFFDLVPVFFAGWFVFLARNAQNGLQFLRLVQAQMIVSIAGCVVGLWPLITLDTSLGLLEYGDVDVFQLVGTAITSLIPAVASLASLIFAGVARARYRRGLKSS